MEYCLLHYFPRRRLCLSSYRQQNSPNLRLKLQPLFFIWNHLELNSIIFLSVVNLIVWRSEVVSNVVRCLPNYKHVIGKDWRLSRHIVLLGFLFMLAYLALWPIVLATQNGKYHAKAVSLAEASISNNTASEDKNIKFYVEWINAGYNSTDNAVKVSGSVTVYDGQKL